MAGGLSENGRLFAALVPPPEVTVPLAELAGEWDLPGRVVPPANWHVTLRFAGRIDKVSFERWLAGMSDSVTEGPVRLRLAAPGAFPGPRRAEVIWLEVRSEELGRLAAEVEAAAVGAGLEPEERPFRPHLTLARVRPPEDVRVWLRQVVVPGELQWAARSIQMLESVAGRYRVVDTIPLE